MTGDSKSPVHVDIGVKASAEFKAEVPSTSMGRLVDALTDAIRPFTEARGLRADQIRLQREDVLIEIASKARARAEVEGKTLGAVPPKLLVPFLERASLEVDDEDLRKRWAALLLSASTSYDARMLSFVDILGRISGAEATLLEDVCYREPHFPSTSYPDSHFETNRNLLEHNCLTLNTVTNDSREHKNLFNQFIADTLVEYGGVLYANVFCAGRKIYFYVEGSTPGESKYDSLAILERERLVQFQTVSPTGTGITAGYFEITRLGLKFVDACGSEDCRPLVRRTR